MEQLHEGGYNGLIKGIIKDIVNETTGIKGTELAVNFVAHCKEHDIDIPKTEDFFCYMDELINTQEIIELDYVLSGNDCRIRSLYFPARTKLYPIGEIETKNK